MTNRLFLNGFASEPHARCVNCHAPLIEQAQEVRRARRELLATRSPQALPPGALAHEGITCVTCHLREGEVLVARAQADTGSHPQRVDPSLARSDFCFACHEFQAHEVADGKTRLTSESMQTTGSEWKRWEAGGGQGTCQSCHMRGGTHDLRGAFDLDVLRAAARLEWVRTARGPVAVLQAQGVGHRFPTGDVFRHLVLWADGVEIARFGKTFVLEEHGDGSVHQRLQADSSLEPGVPVRVDLPPGTRRLSLTYHYAEDAQPRGNTLTRDELVVTLTELSR